MLVVINFNKDNVVFQSEGVLVLKPKFYAQFATVGYIMTAKSDHFPLDDKSEILKGKDLMLGERGGLTLG
jgi:hypothetical protein